MEADKAYIEVKLEGGVHMFRSQCIVYAYEHRSKGVQCL